MKFASLWKSKEGDKSIGSGMVDKQNPPILVRPGDRIVLIKNQSEHERSPSWDLLVYPGDQEQPVTRSDTTGTANPTSSDDNIPW